MKRILFLIAIVILCSCSNHASVRIDEKSLIGTIRNGHFRNDYLSLDIANSWSEKEGNDKTQFLVINKVKNNFNPNIVLLGLNKNQFKNEYGFQTAEEYMISLTENYKAKADYKLISEMQSMQIDNKKIYFSEFLLEKGDKEYRQSYYVTDLDDYYLGIVATDNNKDIEPEAIQIIKSLKFN